LYAFETNCSDSRFNLFVGRRLVNADSCEKIVPNNYGLINMIGNVAEMVDKKGIAKGGTWADKIKDCGIKNNIPYVNANEWLGFRCVCEYRMKK
jgi:hypothetical protein